MAICYWWDTSPDLKDMYCLLRLKIQPAEEHCTFSRTLALSSVFCSRFFVWLVALSRMAWEEKTQVTGLLCYILISPEKVWLSRFNTVKHFVFEMQEQTSIEIIHHHINHHISKRQVECHLQASQISRLSSDLPTSDPTDPLNSIDCSLNDCIGIF